MIIWGKDTTHRWPLKFAPTWKANARKTKKKSQPRMRGGNIGWDEFSGTRLEGPRAGCFVKNLPRFWKRPALRGDRLNLTQQTLSEDLALSSETVEKVPKQTLGQDAKKNDLTECATINDLIIGRDHETPENHPLIILKGFFDSLSCNRVFGIFP